MLPAVLYSVINASLSPIDALYNANSKLPPIMQYAHCIGLLNVPRVVIFYPTGLHLGLFGLCDLFLPEFDLSNSTSSTSVVDP